MLRLLRLLFALSIRTFRARRDLLLENLALGSPGRKESKILTRVGFTFY